MTFFSIIIPAYNAESTLHKCLSCIQKQSFEKDQYEVIIVDNNSDDNSKHIINQFPFIYTFEKKRSSYAARNKGLEIANGEYIVFTDSDCFPDQDWLLHIYNCIHSMQHNIIAGAIEWEVIDNNNVYEYYDKQNFLNQEEYAKIGFGATANLTVHNDIIKHTDGFNSNLISGGDNEFCKRLINAGHKMVYCPDAIIYHKCRSSFIGIYKKYKRIYYGLYQLKINNLLGTRLDTFSIVGFLNKLFPTRTSIRYLFTRKPMNNFFLNFR